VWRPRSTSLQAEHETHGPNSNPKKGGNVAAWGFGIEERPHCVCGNRWPGPRRSGGKRWVVGCNWVKVTLPSSRVRVMPWPRPRTHDKQAFERRCSDRYPDNGGVDRSMTRNGLGKQYLLYQFVVCTPEPAPEIGRPARKWQQPGAYSITGWPNIHQACAAFDTDLVESSISRKKISRMGQCRGSWEPIPQTLDVQVFHLYRSGRGKLSRRCFGARQARAMQASIVFPSHESLNATTGNKRGRRTSGESTKSRALAEWGLC
jgi:hypothetical protein